MFVVGKELFCKAPPRIHEIINAPAKAVVRPVSVVVEYCVQASNRIIGLHFSSVPSLIAFPKYKDHFLVEPFSVGFLGVKTSKRVFPPESAS